MRRLSGGSVRFFSDHSKSFRLFPSRSSLELANTFIRPHLFSIEQLPEIQETLQARAQFRPVCLDQLERATKVFSSIQPGGSEHKAALALLADCQDPSAAIKTLCNLRQYQHSAEEQYALEISLAKAHWLNGDFVESGSICSNLLENESLLASLPPIHAASARTGQAISRICSMEETLDDAFSVRDPFRMVVKSLERVPSIGLALAQLNMGTAEALYAQTITKQHEYSELPLDGAMRSWKQGLTTMKRLKDDSSLLCFAVRAQLLSQMSWGLLNMIDNGNNAKEASELAGEALKIYDSHGGSDEEGMRRILALIGICLHRTGSAVTAEGIFQSAVDPKARFLGPLEIIQLRDSVLAYAYLCRDWEKRERDAERLFERAAQLDEYLPVNWRDKTVLHSSLWFWTPSLFVP